MSKLIVPGQPAEPPVATAPTITSPAGAIPLTKEIALEQAGARARIAFDGTGQLLEAVRNGIAMAKAQNNMRAVAANMGLLQALERLQSILGESVALIQFAAPVAASVNAPPGESELEPPLAEFPPEESAALAKLTLVRD